MGLRWNFIYVLCCSFARASSVVGIGAYAIGMLSTHQSTYRSRTSNERMKQRTDENNGDSHKRIKSMSYGDKLYELTRFE